MTTRTTVRTIERGVRVASSRSRDSNRSGSPIDHVKQQLHEFVDHSKAEKVELHKLNDRMSTYVNRVKALEAENTKLLRDINDIQQHWGDGTRKIREQFEQNLFDVRGRIDDVANLKTVADVRHKRAQYENGELQHRLEESVRVCENDKQKIKNLERELNNLLDSNQHIKKSVAEEIDDIEKYKKQRDDTWNGLVDLLDKLDDELFRRIAVEYNNQTLREHIEFIKQINERELLEMSQLGEALPFNDQIEFYKDQLKRVISNIRKDYEQLHQEQTRDLEEWMRIKKEELANKANERDPSHDLELSIAMENIETLRESYDVNARELDELRRQHEGLKKRLSDVEEHVEVDRANLNETLNEQNNEVKRLNDELDALLNDYNHINTNKASLEYELQVYKRLLDSQLDRLNERRATEVVAENLTSVTSNAFGGKVQNKKEKKGAIGISDSSPDGKFIVIENLGTSSSQIDLSGWQIKRRVDSNNEIVYRIPQGILLAPNKELIVWANSYRQQRGQADLVADFENWGIGINSTSRLVSTNGEEKSSFHQTITFSSRY